MKTINELTWWICSNCEAKNHLVHKECGVCKHIKDSDSEIIYKKESRESAIEDVKELLKEMEKYKMSWNQYLRTQCQAKINYIMEKNNLTESDLL